MILVALFWPENRVAWYSLSGYLLVSLLAIVFDRLGLFPRVQAIALLLIDVVVISTPIQGFGSQTSGFTILYLAPIIAYTITRGPRMGLLALALAQQQGGTIDLLLTDVVMPGMLGPTLATRLIELRGAIPIIFMSGYTRDAVDLEGDRIGGALFLSKPFQHEELLDMIKTALDRGPLSADPAS